MRLPIQLEPSEEWGALSRYNAEKARGIVHTPEWDALMAEEQARFDRQQRESWIAQGGRPVDAANPDGPWWIPGSSKPRWRRIFR